MLNTIPNVQEIASMIDHSLLHPTFSDKDIAQGCDVAIKWKVASVCVKPYAIKITHKLLENSGIKTCTVIGFPHGSHSTKTKIDEALYAISEGATELDMVINIGKTLSRDWEYVADEIGEINNICTTNKSMLKVIFENDYLTDDSLKIKLTEICRHLDVAYVKTSTGYGYVKQQNGFFQTKGATLQDCALMVKHAGPKMKVKAAGGIRTPKDLLNFKALGVTRFGITATDQILSELSGKRGKIDMESPGY